MVARLAAAFPDDRVIGEEGATGGTDHAGQRVWFVDPLDGTTNFAHGLPLFSVSLGLAMDRRPVLGVVRRPRSAGRSRGRRRAAARRSTANRLRPRRSTGAGRAAGDGLSVHAHPVHDNMAEFAALTAAAQGTRRLGSAALDLCFVACGWLDGYWERELHPWDLVGGRRS